jgi:cytochrome c
VVGRPKGGVGDFDYSPAFNALEGEWTFEALNEFLARPADIIPGTAMQFGGISEPQKRANLIAYLRTLIPTCGGADS